MNLPLPALPSLLTKIAGHLGRGPADGWDDYDFELLAAQIQEATGTSLSVTTLKRVWGRVKYRSNPSTTTLNALAGYAGFTDWRIYEQQFTEQDDTAGQPVEDDVNAMLPPAEPRSPRRLPPRRRRWLLGLGVALALVLGLAPLFRPLIAPAAAVREAPVDPANFSFSSRKAKTEGVPNTVVFDYAATAAGDLPVRISQSWDTARSVPVSAYDSVHSSQYFYPGYFNAKLLVGKQVVQTHDLYVTAPGWVGAIHRPGLPIYLDPAHFQDGDTLVADEQTFADYNLTLEPKLPEVRFYRVPEMPEIRTDNFNFTTHLRSEYNGGSGACQSINVLLLCKNDAIVVPLRAEGCTGAAGLFALGTRLSSRNTDFSGFGADLSQWTSLRIEGRDQQLRFLVNDRPALTTTVAVDPKEIIGVSIRMFGPGRVGETTVRGGGYVVRM